MEEVEPLSDVIPLPPVTVSHETPPAAVELAVKTFPSVPIDFAVHVVPEATIRLPVEVDKLFMSFILPGKLKA